MCRKGKQGGRWIQAHQAGNELRTLPRETIAWAKQVRDQEEVGPSGLLQVCQLVGVGYFMNPEP